MFDAGGRSAQTCPLAHVSSPSYDRQNCSTTCRRNISSRVDVSININTTPSLLLNCRKLFLSLFYFFCKGRWNIGKTQKQHFVRFVRNFPSPALLTLERAERVPIDPLMVIWYRIRIKNRIRKVDCACFRHISTSGFREKWHCQCFSAIMHRIDPRVGGNTVLCHRKARRWTMDDRMTCWYPCKHRFAW